MRSIRFGFASRIGRLTAAGLCAIPAVALMPVAARAANFQVSPVMLTLLAKHPVGSLTIRNADAEPVSVKVATYRWTQVDGKDVYTPTDDLIASPPIFTTAGHGAQLVRVGLRRRVPDAAYRVILDEIPSPSAAKGIRISVSLNLPLYVVSDPAAQASVAWTAWRSASGEIVLEGRNQGALHQQVISIALAGAPKPAMLTDTMGVVLPASMRQWPIGKHPELATGSALRLSVRTPEGETEVTANLAAR